MDKLLALLGFLIATSVVVLTFPDANTAILVVVTLSFFVVAAIRHFCWDERILLTRFFITSLFARIVFGTFVHVFDYRDKFSGDSNTYHLAGKMLMERWFGIGDGGRDSFLERFSTMIGWGMTYLVAGIYSITGPEILSAQFFCAVLGAATVPLVYVCVKKIFSNRRASMAAALLVGFYPAFVIWTSQLLKDGLIVFLLVLATAMILTLREKFNYRAAFVLAASLFGILSLRFYVFYMISAAMIGAFVVGSGKSNQSIVRNLIILSVFGLGLLYVGGTGNNAEGLSEYANLDRLQASRSGAARAESGFGQDVDVSTAEGALTAIPLGFVYVMFAPFPWQFDSMSYLITLPDMIIWWLSIPLLVIGLSYSIKNNLRNSLGILIFSLMLTMAYSVFQGNIGTAYRHRIQIQVFLFMFVAVGWTVVQERRENAKALRDAEILRFNSQLKKNARNAFSG